MRRVVVDASVVVAMTFQEAGLEAVGRNLEGATVFAPSLLKYEVANVAVTKMRRQPENTKCILEALHRAFTEDWGIAWHDVDATEAALVARTTGLTAYDASYVWLAGYLGAELVTLDQKVIAATARGQA